MLNIPFNKPYLHGNELIYIKQAVQSGKISGDGFFSRQCQKFFEERFGFAKALMTTSCTDALEMTALLLDIKEGDEVIMPSFTFVSTANAFVLRGAKIIFADSSTLNPNINPNTIEELITNRTKAIVVVHYAGIACDMDAILKISNKYNIPVIEDAAQAIDSYYKGLALGSLGEYGTFSFHETKNIISGEGGILIINSPDNIKRAEIIREKGTNRSSFFRGEIDKYGWVDIGSSFLPSDIISAYLYAQLELMSSIQQRRISLWNQYFSYLSTYGNKFEISLPFIPNWATNNGHIFYLVCNSSNQRDRLLKGLNSYGIHAVFHYQSLHNSLYFKCKHDGRELSMSDHYSDCLVRLPLFYEMSNDQCAYICEKTIEVFSAI